MMVMISEIYFLKMVKVRASEVSQVENREVMLVGRGTRLVVRPTQTPVDAKSMLRFVWDGMGHLA